MIYGTSEASVLRGRQPRLTGEERRVKALGAATVAFAVSALRTEEKIG